MRIVLADDHATLREGLRCKLEAREGIQIVGEAGDGETAHELIKTLQPDICILDITMPRSNGLELATLIHMLYPEIKIIIHSMHAESCIVKEALRTGAHAYVLKGADPEQINLAVDAASENRHYLSPEITDVAINEFIEPMQKDSHCGFASLSCRERQILQLISEGMSTKAIGHHLHLSPKTVDTTRRNIMQKTKTHSIAGLTKMAIREGLTSLEF